jgi:hypothetical protein|tara:strand:- start:353 stop:523 length:171 start_codon:yes stop_codon:yes gene_type:complete
MVDLAAVEQDIMYPQLQLVQEFLVKVIMVVPDEVEAVLDLSLQVVAEELVELELQL